MKCFELMVKEHEHIKRMLKVIRKYCDRILNNEAIVYEDFFLMIDFVRNYADKHHHGKEEALLFEKMSDELGVAAQKLVRHGMYVEHDLGRLYMHDLEEALKKVIKGDKESRLDVIANAVSYTHLLYRHIQKEDDVVYKFAEKNFSKDTLDKLDSECEDFEKEAEKNKLQKKYLGLVEELESRAGGKNE